MTLRFEKDGFTCALADSAADVIDAQKLRYDVFVTELGADGPQVDHDLGREIDLFDQYADHLMLRHEKSGDVIGVYRVMRPEHAHAAGGFYTEREYDLGPLHRCGRRVLELGRSCIRADFRGTSAMAYLWAGLAQYVQMHSAEILFGVASLKGTDTASLAAPLSLLHHRHSAPSDLSPRARSYQRMDLIDAPRLDRRAAMIALPSLIKGYLRLGGMVGDGAFVDHAFNCTDVCMVMDTNALNERYARLYQFEAAQ